MSFWFFILISCLLLIGIEIVKRKYRQSASATRRIAHVGASLIAVLSPIFVSKDLIVIACLVFAGIMLLSHRATLFSSIQNVKRKTFGEVFLPLGEALTAIAFLPHGIKEFQYGVLVMGLSDPFAGFIGEKFGKHEIAFLGIKKSLEGSLAFFTCTLLITIFFFPVLSYQLIVIPTILTFAELLLGYGSDNLILPVFGASLLSMLIFA